MTTTLSQKFALRWIEGPDGHARYVKYGSSKNAVKWTRDPAEAVRYSSPLEALGSKFAIFNHMDAVPIAQA